MKRTLKTLLTLVIVAVVFLVVSDLFGGFSIGVSFGEDSMTLDAPKDYTITAEYDRIQSLELIDLPEDHGAILSGDENRSFSWGERDSEALGRYTLCIANKIDVAILVTMTDGEKLVFNYESAKTTESMLDMLSQLLEHHKGA